MNCYAESVVAATPRWHDRGGQVYLTGDGVLLRARGDDPDRNRQLEAVRVTYAAQPASLFETPAGFQKLDARRGVTMQPSGDGPRGSFQAVSTAGDHSPSPRSILARSPLPDRDWHA